MAQNRGTPFGTIEDLPGRGLFMGNRGVLHRGTERRISRRWTTKAWIICVLEYKDWRAPMWEERRWTPLFFLDEATALAAGHRPCGMCRHADHRRFRDAWGPAPLAEVDATMHIERTGTRPVVDPDSLPDGSMVERDGAAWLVLGDRLLRWSDRGYGDAIVREPSRCTLLTPPSTVRAIAAGYQPILHESAG